MTAATGKKDLPGVLGEIIDTAIALTEADFGNIQLLDSDGRLKIIAHRGFPDWWIEYWNTVTAGHGTCGTSLALGERVIVEDIEQSAIFAGTPALDIQRKAGVRAVQSTPLRGQSGQLLGMLSTHYRSPRKPDTKTLKVLDLLAAHAATLIVNARMEQALEGARDMLAEAQKIAHVGSFEYVVADGSTSWSEEEYRIYGLDPAEPPPAFEELLARCIHPDDAGLLGEALREMLEEHVVYKLEHRIVRPDGSVRWVYNQTHPYFDEQSKLHRYIGTTQDITERKAGEQMLLAACRT